MIKNIPVHMDYVGQGRAEKLYQIIIVLFGVVGLFWGYTIQQFSQTVYILGAGLVLASLLTIPPWGIYRYYLTHLLTKLISDMILYYDLTKFVMLFRQVEASEMARGSPRE